MIQLSKTHCKHLEYILNSDKVYITEKTVDLLQRILHYKECNEYDRVRLNRLLNRINKPLIH